ncbi:hypothetical protein GHT06_014779 [Daphnia sinensis]|uniref:Uncharacterized protein n=1 Tax=Daphnia sinensis TaxID=1820382 RepID=A0AAD5L8H7_9CRUS|nr:hypothetical protein GHT06_014779 [Daphnia sinensis]
MATPSGKGKRKGKQTYGATGVRVGKHGRQKIMGSCNVDSGKLAIYYTILPLIIFRVQQVPKRVNCAQLGYVNNNFGIDSEQIEDIKN